MTAQSKRSANRAWCRALLAAVVVLTAWQAPAMDRPLPDLFRDHWTTRDGLPHNSVNAIAQTPEGYLWLATWEGLVRYNGQTFTAFDRRHIPALQDGALRTLHVDSRGRLVAGGARGTLVRQDGNGGWEALPTAPVMVTSIEGDADDTLWVGTETAGVMRLTPDNAARVLEPSADDPLGSSFGIAVDARGRHWSAHVGGLRRVGPEGLRPAEVRGLPAGPITALVSDGPRLIAGSARGVYVADALADTLVFTPLDPALDRVSISRLLPDGDDGLWIGTLTDGLMRWTPRGLERLGVGPDRPSSRVLSLFIDREGNLWVGTNSGLFRFTDAPFSSLLRQHGLPDDYVRTVLALDDGSVLIGTAQGLARSDANGVVTRLGADTALASASVLSLADAGDGRIWVGTYDDGALLWDGERVTARLDTTNGLPTNEVRGLLAEGGALWLGTTGGLVRWEDGRVQRWTEAEGLPTSFVIALHRDERGRLWIGTGLGALILEDGALRPLDLGAHEDAEYAFGFLADPRRGSMWVASDRGLLRFDTDGRPTGAVGLAAGLPYEKVFGLLLDPQDQLWASGNRGILRMDMARLHAVADGEALPLDVERFTEADGMASAQCNGGSNPVVALDRAGRRWFATSVGATRVDPADLQRHTRNAPPVVIESVIADGRSVPLTARGGVVLPAGARRLELRYAGLGFVLPERLRYRHRLDGFDGDWVERGSETFVEYTRLPPGQYTFLVEAAHPRGAWGESRATVAIEVPPLWWQRPSVVWGSVIAIVLATGVLLRWRLHRLAANERHLAQLVEDRTQEIEQQKARLRHQASEFARHAREDALTGISNRRAFDEALSREFARAKRTDAPLCIAMVDLDHFKRVNDRWTHAVGDEVLKRVAAQLKAGSRGFDVAARWGGEEFVLLLPESTLAAATATCERLRETIAGIDFSDIDPELRITASFGLAEAAVVDDHDRLLQRADEALYRAKANGRNRVEG